MLKHTLSRKATNFSQEIIINVPFTQRELKHSDTDGTQFLHSNKLNSVMKLAFSKFPVESATDGDVDVYKNEDQCKLSCLPCCQ